MAIEKALIGIVPGLMATSLLNQNLKGLNLLGKPRKVHNFSPKLSTKRIVRTGVNNLVGISLIGATARAAGSI